MINNINQPAFTKLCNRLHVFKILIEFSSDYLYSISRRENLVGICLRASLAKLLESVLCCPYRQLALYYSKNFSLFSYLCILEGN
jgi:hypothetical protein